MVLIPHIPLARADSHAQRQRGNGLDEIAAYQSRCGSVRGRENE